MRLLRDAKTLKDKSVASLRTAIISFNSFDDDCRICTVLLHLQHASEMLLKACLVQAKERVFDKEQERAIGFEKCVNLSLARKLITAEEAGVFRSVDAARDAAQHWYIYVTEEILFVQARAFITAFDATLQRNLGTDLYSHLPSRVLPISTGPIEDFDILVDRECKLIGELLKPGRRQRDEARGRIRMLLALEGLTTDEVALSEKDINRIEKAIKVGEDVAKIFPRLNTITTSVTGSGPNLKVHITKKQGAPVRYIGGDDPTEAAAVREIDLQKKFHMRAFELAGKLNLTANMLVALRRCLGIDEDASCRHIFEFGKTKVPCYSDNAYRKIKDAIDGGLDLKQTWQDFRPGRRRPN